MKFKDYYQILGVSRDAGADEVKKAYRRLARKYHPDVSKEADAEERFKEVGEAYEVLKDPEKRAAYDQLGSGWRPGEEFRPPPEWETRFSGQGFEDLSGVDLSDLFAGLFGMGTHRGQAGHARHVADVEVAVTVSLEEAFHGAERVLRVEVPEMTQHGVRRAPREVRVRIPPGVSDGQRLRVPGKGGTGPHAAGDLYLHVHFAPHRWFRPSGHDLYLETPISPWEAALGAGIEVPTLAGKLRVKIPAGARSGQRLRLPGRGLPRPDGGAGDLYAVITVATPPAVSAEERKHFEALAKISRFDPRLHWD